MIDLYKKIITDTHEETVNEGKGDLALYKRQFNDYSAKVSRARDLLLKGDLEASDYRDIKHDCERQVSIIEGKLVQLSPANQAVLGRF